MRRNILIIESSAEHALRIEKMALTVTERINIYKADSIEMAYKMLIEVTMDVIIANVVLDSSDPSDVSGLRIIGRIREMPKYAFIPVIFISSQKDADLYAYKELNCIAYLHKPCTVEEFTRALRRAIQYKTHRNEDRVVFFRKKGVIYYVRVKNIVYIENYDHIMEFHLCDGSKEKFPYLTFGKILPEMDVEFLMQCNRSVVVNKNYIYGVDFANRLIYLRNNWGTLDIGTTYKRKIREEYIKKYPTTKSKDGVIYSNI